ncbi:MAG: sugar-binding domain-containing protein [Bryobacterales bacterium]
MTRLVSVWLALLIGCALGCSSPEAVPEIPRPEHPRPQFSRADWVTLNGPWEFRFDDLDEGIAGEWWSPSAAGFERSIVVPFCWESELSGIHDTGGHQIGWYRRQIEVPGGWSEQRVWLRFEASDWETAVWINGAEVGRHEGGYTPFAFDVTDFVQPGQTATLVARVFDPTDRHLPTGKQVARWYTFTSGIWQTVWLEARPAVHVARFSLVPENRGGSWSLRVSVEAAGTDGTAQVRVSSPDSSVAEQSGSVNLSGGSGRFETELAVSNPRLWSPDDPHLYDLQIELSGSAGKPDRVETYFGLRTIGRGRYGNAEHESVLLNGKPVYLRGALDQSFNPRGVYTAPTDEFLKRDMELTKAAGLNFLRIHIKPDEPRRLYWADKLGVLIMEDMPNTWEQSERARRAWEATMRGVIDRDRNHPSIFAWCLFNETWGLGSGRDYGQDFRQDTGTQQWVLAMWREVKERIDPSRLVEDNSPDKRDHVKTDLNSWHFYIDDYERSRAHIEEVVANTKPGSAFNYVEGFEQDTAPLINSEYGAVSAGGGDRDISWGFRYLTTQLRRHEKIQGYIYTELSDIEFEHNGIYNYDRSAKEFGYDAFAPGMTVADLQGEDFVGFDAPPVIEAEPGGVVEVPVFVSHFSGREEPPTLNAWLAAVNDQGGEINMQAAPKPVRWERYRVVEQEPIRMSVPDLRNLSGAIVFELVDGDGKRIAANFVNIVVRPAEQQGAQGASSPRTELLDARRMALRTAADEFAAVPWKGLGPNYLGRRGKFWGQGAGTVEYRFDVPAAVLAAGPVKLEFLAELATKAGAEKLDWPIRRMDIDYPQTDVHKYSGIVQVNIGGVNVDPIDLPDDPADARGVLSHQAYFHHGSYGFFARRELDLSAYPGLVERLRRNPTLRVILTIAEGDGAHGLSVYGERTGRYPLDPTVIVETSEAIERTEPDTEGVAR